MPLIRDYLPTIKNRLTQAGVYSPEADAELIVSFIMGIPRGDLKITESWEVQPDLMERVEAAVQKREARMPLARIFGHTNFRGLTIKVGEGVFEPCVEVETIVEYAHIHTEKHKGPLRVLDCGTGTGCILLSILNEMPHATGVGIDISETALKLAQDNAAACNLADRASFHLNDWTAGLDEKFDIIVSNPPFVPSSVIPILAPEVRVHDPLASLDGGKDGLYFYRRLAKDFDRLTNPGACGIFQLSLTYCDMVHEVFVKEGYKNASVKRSYFGIPMCVVIQKEDWKPSFFQRLRRSLKR